MIINFGSGNNPHVGIDTYGCSLDNKFIAVDKNINGESLFNIIDKILNTSFIDRDPVIAYDGFIEDFCYDLALLASVNSGFVNSFMEEIKGIVNVRVLEHIPFDQLIYKVLPNLFWLSRNSYNSRIMTTVPNYDILARNLQLKNKMVDIQKTMIEFFGVGEHITAFTPNFLKLVFESVYKIFNQHAFSKDSNFEFKLFEYPDNIDGKSYYTVSEAFCHGEKYPTLHWNLMRPDYTVQTYSDALEQPQSFETRVVLLNECSVKNLFELSYEIQNKIQGDIISLVFIDSEKIYNIEKASRLKRNQKYINFDTAEFLKTISNGKCITYSSKQMLQVMLSESFFNQVYLQESIINSHPYYTCIKIHKTN